MALTSAIALLNHTYKKGQSSLTGLFTGILKLVGTAGFELATPCTPCT